MIDLFTRDGVTILTLRRPPVNAIDVRVVSELSELLSDLANRTNPPPLVITGSEQVFSAGVDYKAYRSYSESGKSRLFSLINEMALQLLGYPAATVAAINGPAVGGGLVLALACDFRIASRGGHRLALAEVRVGIPFPEVPLRIVHRKLPAALLYRLALGGESIDLAAARSAGIVLRTEVPSRLLDNAVDLASSLDGQPGYRAVKRQLLGLAKDNDFIVESSAETEPAVPDISNDRRPEIPPSG